MKMKNVTLKNKIKSGIVTGLIAISATIGFASNATAQTVKNIVLVHGAFADGSGFQKVYDILVKKGFHVSIVQNPLTSLKDDVDATNRILDQQDGPVILAGHSWGGVVISEAGKSAKVVGLVYIAAFEPDNGESAGQLNASLPTAPESGVLPPDANGVLYYDRAKFHAGFAADLTTAEADFMAASQGPIFAQCFSETITDPAWKNKPSYGIVATEDKAINPQIERNMYKHAGAKITEIKASHVVFISHADAVAKVIIEAAENTSKGK
jgi:pimeloyl-ACP methyl ester carboxylesterase